MKINMKKTRRMLLTSAMALTIAVSLSACSSLDRIADVGSAPKMEKIQNPHLKAGYQPVSMPMPSPDTSETRPNSLWSSSRKNFFKDQRATQVGDILTVLINIKDTATMDNESKRSRNSNEDASMPNMLGYEGALGRLLPEAVSPASLVGLSGTSGHTGKGEIDREEAIDMRMAAVITQVLPNGNLVISGSQEVLVNYEKRKLQIDGVIRPEDVSINNTISHEQIAEARIVYGGQGQMTDVQQPRYGQQVYDILFPF